MPRSTSLSAINAEEALEVRLNDCTRDLVAIGRGNDTEEDRVLLSIIQEEITLVLFNITIEKQVNLDVCGWDIKYLEKIREIERDIEALSNTLPYPREYIVNL
jgi:hypothetical protein